MPQIITVPLRFSNAFLIKGRKAILVDSGSPKDASVLFRAIADAGVHLQVLSLILHTHAHYDHCGCTAALREKSEALVAIHREDADHLAAGENAPIAPVTALGRMLQPIIGKPHSYSPVSPDIQLDDEFDLQPFGVDGKAIWTPGHTNGSISIVLNRGDAIVGDLIGGGKLLGLIAPRQPRYHHWYSDFPAAKESLARILGLNPARIYVGHGGPLTGSATRAHFSDRT